MFLDPIHGRLVGQKDRANPWTRAWTSKKCIEEEASRALSFLS